MSLPYSSARYFPPIPVLPIQMRLLNGEATTDVIEALVDTGADLTIVPLGIIHGLGALGVMETTLVSQWGDVHSVTLYLVDLLANGTLIPSVEVAGDETAIDVILGRNVLNKFPLFLDGPQQYADILDDASLARIRARRKKSS